MSFDIALSGIQAINEQLNTISHNIANAGTYGYKSGRANFSSIYAGTKGAGVEVGSVSQNIALNGSTISTGNSMTAAIDGRGFFVTKDATGETSYTRVAILHPTPEGNIVDSNGRTMMGYPVILDANGRPTTTPGGFGPMKIVSSGMPAKASENVTFNGNLPSSWDIKTAPPAFDPTDSSTFNLAKTTPVTDSQGNTHNLTQYFVKTADNTIQVHLYVGTEEVPDGAGAGNANPAELIFDGDGLLTSVNGVAGGKVTLGATTTLPGGVDQLTLSIDYTGMTQFAGDISTNANDADGYPPGALSQLELATDGSVMGKYSNGESVSFGRLAIANFTNPEGLRAVSDTSWVETRESGAALTEAAGTSSTANLMVARVENSNVDITSELVSLMTSQRNYQANSKVITTENQMLQSLMQAL